MTYSFIDLDGLPDLEGSSPGFRLKVNTDTERVWLVRVERQNRTYHQAIHQTLQDGKWVETRKYNV